MPTNEKVVTLTPLPGGGPSPWQMTMDGVTSNPGSYPKIKLPAKSGPHMIIFEIADTAQGVTFAEKQPIWIQQGGKPHKWAKDDMIASSVGNGGKKLYVVDWNSNDANMPSVDLHYRLNFKGHGDLDPIIENGGGTLPPPPPPPPSLSDQSGQAAPSALPGSREFMGADVTMLLIGAGVLFLLGVLIGRFSK